MPRAPKGEAIFKPKKLFKSESHMEEVEHSMGFSEEDMKRHV